MYRIEVKPIGLDDQFDEDITEEWDWTRIAAFCGVIGVRAK